MKNRKLLMIPGPIEFEPSVLQALGAPTQSHVAPDFIETFASSIELMKQVWLCPSGQPLVVAGSGTLAMDMAGANLIEQGDKALVLSTGYFGDRFAQLLKRYGADVTVIEAPAGETVDLNRVESELKTANYKVLTLTHVDTSTAVKMDPKPAAALAAKYGAISILDGVCSVAGEELRQEDWGIDIVLTASQKAIGVPPGLALMVVSDKALSTWKNRKSQVGNYYADWHNWLPIMNAYSERKPSYFGTPPVNLISALKESLELIVNEGMSTRFERHSRLATAFRSAMHALGLKMLPVSESVSANTLSAVYYPDIVDGGAFLSKANEAGVILAGGLLPDLKTEYFRVGHMGAVNQTDILGTIGAIEQALTECGCNLKPGSGLQAARKVMTS